jgi:hypothetical protein
MLLRGYEGAWTILAVNNMAVIFINTFAKKVSK